MDARTRTLTAAATVFAEVGFRGATTRRIASEAEVNEITLFRHFGSKERLLREAVHAASARYGGASLPELPKRPRQELLVWAREQMARLRERRGLIRTCMAEVAAHPKLAQPGNHTSFAAAQLTGYLEQLTETGLATARFEPAAATQMLMGALFADALGRDMMPDLYPNDPDQAVEQYVELFLRGIGCGAATRRRTKSRAK
ncbi:MAG: TetR family transcriptional regulator [Gemmatimonadota bacterium]